MDRKPFMDKIKTKVGDVGVGDTIVFVMGAGHKDEAEVQKVDTAYKDLSNKGRVEVIDRSKRILWVYPSQVKEIKSVVAKRVARALCLIALSETEMRRALPPAQQDAFQKMFTDSLSELVVRDLMHKARRDPDQIERIKRRQFIQTIASTVFDDLKKLYDKLMEEAKTELSVDDVLSVFGENVAALLKTTR
jgi:hypothetical protein